MNFMPKPRLWGYFIFQTFDVGNIINISLILVENGTSLSFCLHLLSNAGRTDLLGFNDLFRWSPYGHPARRTKVRFGSGIIHFMPAFGAKYCLHYTYNKRNPLENQYFFTLSTQQSLEPVLAWCRIVRR